mgnify:CR=1
MFEEPNSKIPESGLHQMDILSCSTSPPAVDDVAAIDVFIKPLLRTNKN